MVCISCQSIRNREIDKNSLSYQQVQQLLNDNVLPSHNVVHVQKMVDHFFYDYPRPQHNKDFLIYSEIAQCPWDKNSWLLHIGIQGRMIRTGRNILVGKLDFKIDFDKEVTSYRLVGMKETPSKFHEKSVQVGYSKTLLYEIKHTHDYYSFSHDVALVDEEGNLIETTPTKVFPVAHLHLQSSKENTSKEIKVIHQVPEFTAASAKFKLAASTAMFAMFLRQELTNIASLNTAKNAIKTLNSQKYSFKDEYIRSINTAQALTVARACRHLKE